jgi:hypothetical protein
MQIMHAHYTNSPSDDGHEQHELDGVIRPKRLHVHETSLLVSKPNLNKQPNWALFSTGSHPSTGQWMQYFFHWNHADTVHQCMLHWPIA